MKEPESTEKGCIVDEVTEGMEAFRQCRWQDAVRCLNAAFSRDPSNIDVAGRLAFALSQARDYSRAIEVLQHIYTLQPQRAVWPYMIGYQFYMKGEWTQAVQWFNTALDLNPDYIKTLYRKGYAQLQLGQRNDALDTLNRCIEAWHKLPPDDQQAERKYYGKANFQLGKAYLNVGLTLKARRPLEIAASLDGNDADRRYELGKCLLKNGDPDGAIAQLTEANSLKPGVDYVLDRLAQALIAKGDLAGAEKTYRMLPEQRRRSFVLNNLGRLYLDQGQATKALRILWQATRKDPNSHNAQYLLGRALEALDQKAAARQAYSRAVALRQQCYGRDFPDAEAKVAQLDSELASIGQVANTAPNNGDERGVIDHYNAQRGFGFITSQSGRKVFFHITSIVGRVVPVEGSLVSVRYEDSEKGPKATRVDMMPSEEDD